MSTQPDQAAPVLFAPFPKDLAPRRYKGAPATIGPGDYILEWCPTHPSATHGVVFQHRLVKECELGRFLTKTERVHHLDHNRQNNDPANLELSESQSAHMTTHWAGRGKNDPTNIALVRQAAADPAIQMSAVPLSPTLIATICRENGIEWRTRRKLVHLLDETTVHAALQGRTTKEAAAHLGVNQQSLYNRFSHLLTKRASPRSLDAHKEEIRHKAYVLRLPKTQIAAEYGVGRPCLVKSMQRWRREDATRAGFVVQPVDHPLPEQSPGRTEPGTAPPLTAPAGGLRGSAPIDPFVEFE